MTEDHDETVERIDLGTVTEETLGVIGPSLEAIGEYRQTGIDND